MFPLHIHIHSDVCYGDTKWRAVAEEYIQCKWCSFNLNKSKEVKLTCRSLYTEIITLKKNFQVSTLCAFPWNTVLYSDWFPEPHVDLSI